MVHANETGMKKRFYPHKSPWQNVDEPFCVYTSDGRMKLNG